MVSGLAGRRCPRGEPCDVGQAGRRPGRRRRPPRASPSTTNVPACTLVAALGDGPCSLSPGEQRRVELQAWPLDDQPRQPGSRSPASSRRRSPTTTSTARPSWAGRRAGPSTRCGSRSRSRSAAREAFGLLPVGEHRVQQRPRARWRRSARGRPPTMARRHARPEQEREEVDELVDEPTKAGGSLGAGQLVGAIVLEAPKRLL